LKQIVRSGAKYRYDDTGTVRSDSFYRTVVLSENHTGQVRSVPAGEAPVGTIRNERLDNGEARALEAIMRQIDWPVEERNADARIAACKAPQVGQPRDWSRLNLRCRHVRCQLRVHGVLYV
jgi:hypothetical protein